MFRRFLSLALLAVPLAVACRVSEEAGSFSDSKPKASEDGPIVAPEAPNSTPDPNATDSGTTIGLCGVTTKTCTPDDDGTLGLTAETHACATPVVTDGGALQGKTADASTADFACRVRAKDGPTCPTEADPKAAANADKNGVDGVECQTDAECAPGFDCVAAAKGEKTNVCRRYCCSSSCDGVTSHNGGPTFCDVRKVVRSEAAPSDSPLLAPVCMPIKTCTLLKDGECADGETCAIVNDRGVTGCVPTDGALSAKEKQSCEKRHCDAGLTCLGTPGDRTCYKLCKTTGGQGCGDGQVCTTGSAFTDTSYGVCKSSQ